MWRPGLTTATILTMLLLPLLVGISIGSLQLYTLTQETLGGDQLDVAVRRVRSELQAEIGRRKESLFALLQPMLPTDPEIADPDKQLQSQREYFDSKLVLIQSKRAKSIEFAGCSQSGNCWRQDVQRFGRRHFTVDRAWSCS